MAIQINSTGTGTKSWAVTSGSLPTGLSLGSSNGQLTGTPTTIGTYSFTITVANACTSDAQAYTVEVCSALEITTTSLSGMVVGTAI